MKIALIIGHRPSSQGAYGNLGISEYKFNQMFVLDLLEQARELDGIEFKAFYRQDKRGYEKNMRELHHRVDTWGADIDIEFHFNAAGNPLASGYEILYASSRGEQVASVLLDYFGEYMPYLRNRGIKQRITGRGAYGLKVGKSISLITEPFFATHQSRFVGETEERTDLIYAYISFFGQIFKEHTIREHNARAA